MAEGLQAARRRVIEAGDGARHRLARDLHDGAQQQLVACVIELQLAARKVRADPSRAQELVDSALAHAKACLSQLRDLAAGIHPPILTHLGLGAAVESLAVGLPLAITLELTDQRFAPTIEVSMYFFVSEALANVLKHAQASEATISIAPSNGSLVVEVVDDGVGGAGATELGTGLLGLTDRVSALDGTLSVVSPPGAGTTLHAVIPL